LCLYFVAHVCVMGYNRYNKDLDKIKVDLSDRPTDSAATAAATTIDDSNGFGSGEPPVAAATHAHATPATT
jgi:hypothetical protein